jgi:hypothetical protein
MQLDATSIYIGNHGPTSIYSDKWGSIAVEVSNRIWGPFSLQLLKAGVLTIFLAYCSDV